MEKQARYEAGPLERMGVMTSEGMVYELEGLGRATATFLHVGLMLDPKGPVQAVTICLVRLLDGNRNTYVGTAVCNPNDQAVLNEIGKRIAFIRALQQALPDLPQEASHIARKALWEYRLERLEHLQVLGETQ